MKKLRSRFDRFCFRHRDKGIPNLMLYVVLGSALVNLMTLFARNSVLYDILCFSRSRILQGEIWRLITYPLTFTSSNLLLTAISLLCYYSLGRAMENVWGTLRFNLFYLSGVVMMDIFCLIFSGQATASYLNLSLFLAYATMYPDAQFLFLFVIPVKARIFALLDLAITLYDVISMTSIGYFPYSLFPLVAIGNYLLFFGKDVLNVIPVSWRMNARRLLRKKPKQQQGKTIPFPSAGSYQATVAKPQAPYTHKCTICGRTDVTNPELEFRYCSRCNGYHCYCQDHISNHTHME